MNCNGPEMLNYIENLSMDIVKHFIYFYKGDISMHKTALKLVASTRRYKADLESFIPADWSPIDYALRVLTN